jgi:hypothetical protein
MVAGQHRHRARPAAAYRDYHPGGPAGDVAAARVAQVAADQPGPGAQADQTRRPHPPLRGGLGIGQREIAADLRGTVRLPGPFPGQRRVHRIQLRHDPAADEPQVRAQRPPRHPGQARRAPGEPLGHRRVQQHPGNRLKAQPGTEVGELARRPQ